MNNTVKTALLLCTGAVVGISMTFTQGVFAGRETASELPLSELQTFVEILNRVQQDYVEQIDDDALLESAIRGMLSGLDPHSAYLDAQEFKDITISTSGKFGGLGIEVQGQNGFVRVIAPIDDTPAQRAGVEAGDLIIKVNDTAVKGLTLNESVRLMRGEPGTKVTLEVVRQGEPQPLEIDIVRDIIEVRSVRSRMLEPNYGYVRISTFTGGTGRLLEEEIQKLREKNETALRGLVLDLRTNPGGVLNAAVDVSDAFLNKGKIVSIKGRSDQANRTFNATPGDLLDGVPIVVLINEASASASEIVAGALQDHSRAVLVGAKTFGKGSVQTIVPLKNDAAIKLTTARYYTPSGRSIQAEGINPDIAIERVKVEKRDGPKAITEADLAGRLDNDQLKDLLEADDEEGGIKSDPNLAENDFGLFEALNILKGLSILEQARR
ncbi:S41 family peptidase [uncultured Abyssibacter sp.]|uniref:S41 family peptidase n=1 Tax=uncultured Abyssibacter sp. TaxID=2320202 RepID=UPI0032B21F46